MGLKSKLNKMKNFLFDEEEVKEEKKPSKTFKDKKSDKKENIKKVQEDFSEVKESEDFYFEDISDNVVSPAEIKSRVTKKEQEFKFPEFNDDDFMVSKSEFSHSSLSIVKEEPKPVLYQGSKRKEETKKFKPSPIISPIYGLLDKDGNKAEKKSKSSDVLSHDKDEISFDDVRKKAYGKLDEEIENTMKRLSKKTIEEAEKDMEKEELVEKELSREKQKAKKIKEVSPISISNEDNDDMILPNVDFKEIDVDKERKNSNVKVKKVEEEFDDDDDDTKEQDLFNLIDTMYQNKEDED